MIQRFPQARGERSYGGVDLTAEAYRFYGRGEEAAAEWRGYCNVGKLLPGPLLRFAEGTAIAQAWVSAWHEADEQYA